VGFWSFFNASVQLIESLRSVHSTNAEPSPDHFENFLTALA
jgi:hypothetical protein